MRSTVRGLQMAFGWTRLTLSTLVLYPLAYLPGRPRPWYRRLFRYWCRAWVDALGVELRLHHVSSAPLPRRFILIANHPSAFEDVGIPALFDVDSLAKAEVRDWWIVGRISAAAGTLYVVRESRRSRAQAAGQLLDRLRAGRNLALYPEGGIKGKRLHSRFHHGAFEASLRTGIPIVPVFLHYAAEDDFYWAPQQSLLRKLLDIMRARDPRADYYVHDAFRPQDFTDKQAYCAAAHAQFLRWQDIHTKPAS